MSQNSNRRVRLLTPNGFASKVNDLIRDVFLEMLFLWGMFGTFSLAAIVVGVINYLGSAGQTKSTFVYMAVMGAICLVAILLRALYSVILMRVRLTHFVADKLLAYASDSEVLGDNLPESFDADAICSRDKKMRWTPHQAVGLSYLVQRLDGLTQVFVHLSMMGAWGKLNRSTLRIAGSSEFCLREAGELCTLPIGASWVEPWREVDTHSLPTVNLIELSAPESVIALISVGFFLNERLLMGGIFLLFILPFLLYRLALLVRVFIGHLEQSVKGTMRTQESS